MPSCETKNNTHPTFSGILVKSMVNAESVKGKINKSNIFSAKKGMAEAKKKKGREKRANS